MNLFWRGSVPGIGRLCSMCENFSANKYIFDSDRRESGSQKKDCYKRIDLSMEVFTDS